MEGNQHKMREALVAMVEAETDGSMERDYLCGRCLEKIWDRCKHDGSCWVDKVINALAAPPRNCDVGTAEEQAERMRLYCNSHGEDESGCFRCDKCPLLTVEMCELAWAQMPYEEGGAK